MTACIVIPARMASSRYPNKPLAKVCGKTMIERVWNIGKASKKASGVFIATDSPELQEFAESFGAKVIMTSPTCPTGSDRVAEAVDRLGISAEIVFSLQGDALLTPPWVIDEVLQTLIAYPNVQIATPAVKLVGSALTEFVNAKKRGSTSGTSVVFDKNHQALYFSKALIPFDRQENRPDRLVYRHIGLYGYRLDALKKFNQLSEGVLEKCEQLEQLRALENGIPIRIVEVDYRGHTHGSVDCLEDVAVVEALIQKEGELI